MAFVTSDTTPATNTDIGYYNQFVQNLANLAGIGDSVGISWFCIGSTSTKDANQNAPVSAPVYRLDGVQVATGYADLWDGPISAPINVTETLVTDFDVLVWTGSSKDGLGLNGSELGSSDVRFGYSWWTGSKWIDSLADHPEINLHSLYALSEELTVPIPEPSTLVLLGVGFLGLVGYVVRRKRRLSD